MAANTYGEPLAEDEVVIHVAKGMADRVRIEELDVEQANAEITVRVSKRRSSADVPLLGVMVEIAQHHHEPRARHSQ